MEFQETVTIQKPVEEVFAYMSNAENDAEWRTNVVEIEKVSPGEKGVGTEYRQVVKGPMGKGLDADLRYTEFEPNQRVAFETISGAVRPSAVIEFTPLSESSTQVRITMTWEPKGAAKATAPVVGRMLESSIKESYANLPRVLESRPG
jgi:uncharacterized membrane protein